MKVSDVMTRDVITVAPGASIRTAAQLMVDHAVSGLPVVDDAGALVGILSEGDLILRQKPRAWQSWWQVFFIDPERLAREYQKAMGMTVAEVMTRAVISVTPDDSLASAAEVLDGHRIRRLPVVVDGALVGIVSRGDLVKALAAARADDTTRPSDAQLVSEMNRRLAAEPWTSGRNVVVEAEQGVITLWGIVDSGAEQAALSTMARSTPGCRDVRLQLILRSEIVSRYGAV
jgi:CBS domain-containing protein